MPLPPQDGINGCGPLGGDQRDPDRLDAARPYDVEVSASSWRDLSKPKGGKDRKR